MNGLTEAGVTILGLIIGVATLSVILSPKSNTVGVIQAGASGFSNSLATALSPVTGNAVSINTGYPNAAMGSLGAPITNFGSPNVTG